MRKRGRVCHSGEGGGWGGGWQRNRQVNARVCQNYPLAKYPLVSFLPDCTGKIQLLTQKRLHIPKSWWGISFSEILHIATFWDLLLRTLRPLTAFKNAPNPKLVQFFFFVPTRGAWICQEFVGNFKNDIFRANFQIFDKFLTNSVSLIGTPKKNIVGTNLGFRGVLNAVRGQRVRKRRLCGNPTERRGSLKLNFWPRVAVCTEEAGNKVFHRRRKGDRQQLVFSKHSPSHAQTSTSKQRMVVVCLSIRRPYDERESSRKGMELSFVWTACGHIITRQNSSEVIGWQRICRIPSRHRCLAEWYCSQYARWNSGQRSSTKAPSSLQVPFQSSDRSQWVRERNAVARYQRRVREIQMDRSRRSNISR